MIQGNLFNACKIAVLIKVVSRQIRDDHPILLLKKRYDILKIIPRNRHNTTNAIENFNRQLRKVTKSKSIFPTNDTLLKSLYLAMVDITKKWTGKAWDWGQTLDQFCIYFEDRIQPEDLI